MAISRRRNEEGVKPPPTPPDYQEQAALDRAAKALEDFRPGIVSPKNLATVAISAWILERAKLTASPRLTAERVFDLGNARLRGYLEAALPHVGANLSHLPADKPFFELEKDQVLDVLVAGIEAAREAAMAAGESLSYPFSDEIPF
jgi:hypothetical protein